MLTNKYDVQVRDLDRKGIELSDEELRATHGGLPRSCYEMIESSCMVGGGYDYDDVVAVAC